MTSVGADRGRIQQDIRGVNWLINRRGLVHVDRAGWLLIHVDLLHSRGSEGDTLILARMVGVQYIENGLTLIRWSRLCLSRPGAVGEETSINQQLVALEVEGCPLWFDTGSNQLKGMSIVLKGFIEDTGTTLSSKPFLDSVHKDALLSRREGPVEDEVILLVVDSKAKRHFLLAFGFSFAHVAIRKINLIDTMHSSGHCCLERGASTRSPFFCATTVSSLEVGGK